MLEPAQRRMSLVRVCERTALLLTVALLASHWMHLSADPPTRMGWSQQVDWSADLFTDEGLDSAGAPAAVLRGDWHVPGDFNLAVDAPLWSVLLYVAFKFCGVGIVVARGLTSGLYAATLWMAYLFVRRGAGRLVASVSVLLLAANFLTMTFSRLALLEPVWLFSVAGALLVAQRVRGLRGAGCAGVLLGLAVLTKLTAVCGLLPLLAVLYAGRDDGGDGPRLFLRRAWAAGVAALAVVVPYRVWALRRFPADHALYMRINVADRAVHGLHGLVRILGTIVRTAVHLDGALLLSLACATGVAGFLAWRRGRLDPVAAVCVSWLAANVAVCCSVMYFPPRYCVSLMVPATILAVIGTRDALRCWPPLGMAMAALLAVSFGWNSAATLRDVAHPAYSYAAFCDGLKERARRDWHGRGSAQPKVMGIIAGTVSLYTGLPSMNDDLGTAPRWSRIASERPAYYLSWGPAHAEAVQDFRLAGASLEPGGVYDVLDNYYETRKPVYVYAVRWRGVTGRRDLAEELPLR